VHRVYGEQRLPRLLDGFRADETQFWAKQDGAWRAVDRAVALGVAGSASFYALGLFVLSAA
jgi:hypothetical protein